MAAGLVAALRRESGGRSGSTGSATSGGRRDAISAARRRATIVVFVAGSATVEALDDGRASRRCTTCRRLRPLHPPAHALARPVPRQRGLRRHGDAAPRAAALRAGGVRAWRCGGRAGGGRRLRDYCRGELLDHEDYIRAYAGASVAVNVAVLGAARRPRDPGCKPAAVRAGRDRRAPGGGGSSRHPPPLPRGLGDPGGAHPRPSSRRSLAEALQDRAWAEQVAAGARQRALARAHLHAPAGRAARGGAGDGSGDEVLAQTHSLMSVSKGPSSFPSGSTPVARYARNIRR